MDKRDGSLDKYSAGGADISPSFYNGITTGGGTTAAATLINGAPTRDSYEFKNSIHSNNNVNF